MGFKNKSRRERGMQRALLQGNIASQLRGSLKQDKKMKEKRQRLGLFPPAVSSDDHLRRAHGARVEQWEKIKVYGCFLS